MREIALFEAKSRLSGLLDQVALGQQFVITRHGKAVARLLPMEPSFDKAKARQAAKALLAARQGVTLDGLSIKSLVNEGRP